MFSSVALLSLYKVILVKFYSTMSIIYTYTLLDKILKESMNY